MVSTEQLDMLHNCHQGFGIGEVNVKTVALINFPTAAPGLENFLFSNPPKLLFSTNRVFSIIIYCIRSFCL